ncbi:MAG: PEP/pyruvate-binding domain-containing protein [Candidatus Limnocylindrales bacterium]
MTGPIARLGDASADPAVLGGKGASLQRLAAAGFDVPPGFCVTAEAFRAHLAAPDRATRAAAAAARLPEDAARRELVALVTDEPLPLELRVALDAAIAQLVRTLGSTSGEVDLRFAVRSSGLAEDSAGASFAGAHDTELGVRADGIEAALRRCWASLWGERAIAYRLRRGVALEGDAMAVVVQALVPADMAAVVFTRHPVTGRTDQLLVNAVRGLGEALVSGAVTPDSIVIDKATRAMVEYVPGERGERLVAAMDGGVVAVADADQGPVLDAAALAALVDLCLRVEREFGAPIDIEAAAAAGRWYLLQARPITA